MAGTTAAFVASLQTIRLNGCWNRFKLDVICACKFSNVRGGHGRREFVRRLVSAPSQLFFTHLARNLCSNHLLPLITVRAILQYE